MGKKLVFGLLALGMLASCSKENYPDVPEEIADVPVMITANTGNLVTVTRGSGVVGGVEGIDANNNWNGQSLFLYGFLREGTTGRTADMVKENALRGIFNKKALAPTGTGKGNVTWDDGNTVYYPRNGAYDFFGYHVDDANTSADPSYEETADGVAPGVKETIWSIPVKIDGSQDLMIAKAILTSQDSLVLAKSLKGDNTYVKPANGYENDPDYDKMVTEWNKAFSSYTARKIDNTDPNKNGIQPTMKFKHMLTRLRFFVKGVPNVTGSDEVYIRSVKVKSKNTGKLVFAYKAEQNAGLKWDSNGEVQLSLKELPADGSKMLTDLNKGIVEHDLKAYPKKDDLLNALQSGGVDGKTTVEELFGKYHSVGNKAKQIGESLMLNAEVESYELEVEVMQYYDGQSSLLVPPTDKGQYYTWKDPRWWKYPITVKASDIKKNGTSAGITRFAPGNSYDVTILVNGYQSIDITASLGAWIDGGSVDYNPDDNDF